MDEQALIEALRRELSGYQARNLPDRVELVEDQLRALGALPPKPKRLVPPQPKRVAKKVPGK